MNTIIFANGMFNNSIAGGDVHTINTIQAYKNPVVIGSYFLKKQLDISIPFTETYGKSSINESDKVKLIFVLTGRLLHASAIALTINQKPELSVAATDYWFDIIPMMCSRSKKILVPVQMIPKGLYHKINSTICLSLLKLVKGKVILTATQSQVKDYLVSKGFSSSSIHIISNGADKDNTGDQEKIYDIAWIGRIHPQKNIPLLVDTINKGNFTCIMIGHMEGMKLLINKQIKLAGFLKGDEKYKAIKSARVFVLTSSHEGSPVCIEEALECDVPVVATNINSIRSAFGDMINYTESNPKRLIEVIRKQMCTTKQIVANRWDAVRVKIQSII